MVVAAIRGSGRCGGCDVGAGRDPQRIAVGKTILAQNLAHHAVLRGFTARFTTASAMLGDLDAQDGPVALRRRLHRYVKPALLVIDEIGYLPYSNRYADLLQRVVEPERVRADDDVAQARVLRHLGGQRRRATELGAVLLEELPHAGRVDDAPGVGRSRAR